MTGPALPDLRDDEQLITDAAELLYRQVTIHTWDEVNRQPSSKAFEPSSFDGGMASFSRESKVTAQEARDHHSAKAKSKSLGVWALSVTEVDAEGLRAVDDSATEPPPEIGEWPPGHCFVDYRHLGKREIRVVRGLLLTKALARREIPTT